MPASRLLQLAARVAESLDGERLSDDGLVAAIRDVGVLRRLVDAAGVRLTAELDERCAGDDATTPERSRGYVGVPALLSGEAGVENREAGAWRSVATAVADRVSSTGEPLPPRRPVLAAAVAEGSVSVAAADRIVRALDHAAVHVGPERVDEIETILVACAPRVTERELRGACRRIVDLVDPDGVPPRDDDLRRRSSLTVHQQDDGLTRIVALLHPEAAAYVLAALDARTAPRRLPVFAATGASPATSGESRPLANRRADALASIARDVLAHDPGQLAGAPVTVMISMTLDQLTTGEGAARILGVDEPISAGTARRMASDAAIIPIVLGSESEILDQGRATRLATPAQRRALAQRDRGCGWIGCSAPPGWCEVAHLRPWADGGPTDLDNLMLLCAFHHRLFDHEGWGCEWRGGVPWFIPPAHVDPTRTPRPGGPAVPLVA